MAETVKKTDGDDEIAPFLREDVDPRELFGTIEAPLGVDYKYDMTGAPLWKRIWYKILRMS